MILDFEMVNSGMGKGIKKTFPNFGNRVNEKKIFLLFGNRNHRLSFKEISSQIQRNLPQ